MFVFEDDVEFSQDSDLDENTGDLATCFFSLDWGSSLISRIACRMW